MDGNLYKRDVSTSASSKIGPIVKQSILVLALLSVFIVVSFHSLISSDVFAAEGSRKARTADAKQFIFEESRIGGITGEIVAMEDIAAHASLREGYISTSESTFEQIVLDEAEEGDSDGEGKVEAAGEETEEEEDANDETDGEEAPVLFIGLRRDRLDGDDQSDDSSQKESFGRHMDPGLRDLMERSKNLTDEPYDLSAAICHKTIFGTIDLWTFIDWAVYNHMLGFDHIFVSYLPGIEKKDGFAELVSLPYVTAWENTRGYIEKQTSDLNDTIKETLWTQHKLEEKCLKELAVDYDWVMNADADEYLWFNQSMGVKEFLTKMDEQHYDYVSLGKWFYSPDYRDEHFDEELGNDSGFYLADYPFTIGPHCGRVQGQAGDVCFGGPGRCKTIVKPSQHFKVHVHGTHDPDTREESLQMPSAWGHFKEWQSANTPSEYSPLIRPPESFWAQSMAQARVAKFGNFVSDPEKGAEIRYDANISAWFEYVAHRRA